MTFPAASRAELREDGEVSGVSVERNTQRRDDSQRRTRDHRTSKPFNVDL